MIRDKNHTGRLLYIFEAAFEYFISLLIGGAYLAKLTEYIGISDSTTGILTSFISLGCSFQIFAVFLSGRKKVKTLVTVMHTVNQLCFTFLYVVPVFPFSRMFKTITFVVLLLAGQIISNIVVSPKINWLMSRVEEGKRGVFTADKETVSLIGGMIFTFVMGAVIDSFEKDGDMLAAFSVCAGVLFVLSVLHMLTLIFSEETVREEPSVPVKEIFRKLAGNKKLYQVMFVSVLWSIANYATVPFFGTYQNKELGFSMVFISVINVVYSLSRALVSHPLGRFGDKFSFPSMLNICFIAEAAAFLINVFTVPSNGHIFYTIYYILYAVGMGGIGNGEINLIYDHAGAEMRTAALALKNAIAGIVGFLTTFAFSFLVSHIQGAGNVFLGISVYAQQVLSAVGFFVTVLCILYINLVVRKIKRGEEN